MLAPLSWLKDYVEIKLPLKDLMWKMTEAGLTTEKYLKEGKEIILDVEVTPNRPDWLCILGIARDIAAIEGVKVTPPKSTDIPAKTASLPLNIKGDFTKLSGRYTGLTIAKVSVKPSPPWMQERLKLVGLRPINNLVDISNYVMFELGLPIHIFDYDKFLSKTLTLQLAQGGEDFTSVDDISYKLPKNALIIKDEGRVIDLCGIKGGANTGISETTKNIFIHLPIYSPILIRRASQAIGLASDASYIYERGANAGGTLEALKRVVSLITSLSGGKIASEVIDKRTLDTEPRRLDLNLVKLEKVLGIKVADRKEVKILSLLNLSPKRSGNKISCLIPTYRGDIKIEEDLIEEVARIYGYNKFPKTIPAGTVSTSRVPYYFDDSFHQQLKDLLVASGYSEVMNLSLISKELIDSSLLDSNSHIKISNPVSRDYEYLRISLIPSLLNAVLLNQSLTLVQLFELDKVYLGKPGKTVEPYKLAGITSKEGYRELKGLIDILLARLHISNIDIKTTEALSGLWHPVNSGDILIGKDLIGTFGEIHPKVQENLAISEKVYAFEFDVALLQKHSKSTIYRGVPKYPAQIEDLTFTFPPKTKIGEVLLSIKQAVSLIFDVQLTTIYHDSYTFRIAYLDPNKTLTDNDVNEIRNKVAEGIKQKFGGIAK